MAHGGYQKRRGSAKPKRDSGRGRQGLGAKRSLDKGKVKKKPSIKNQIRAVERLLKKNLPAEVQDVQKKRLEDLKNQGEEHQRAELERKMALRYHKVKFFERRKIERRIKQLEKLLEGTNATEADAMKEHPDLNTQLAQLKEDLEYVRFFPRTEKYVSLFEGNEDEEVLAKRSRLREQIKANLAAAEAAGVEPDDTYDDEDPAMAISDDDFFLADSTNDNAEASYQFTFTSSKPGPRRTLKTTATPSAKHTPVSNKKQSGKNSRNAQSSSKSRKQGPGPIFRNKDLVQDSQRHYPVGSNNKIKGRNLDDQMQHPNSKEKNITERIARQTPKFAAPSSSVSRSRGKHQQARSQPESTRGFARSVIASKDNADSFSVPSHASLDSSKKHTIPELGSSSMPVQKKRRRKHRPKKKKA
ncbi:hypothetical protein GOP47_0017495 [Adiantum capillus-veneris]|uniref:rRNA-processing protein EFG1 n=1 Tax=Adiantum capillus-veneris TaxID=13818 RepID=A0A9D4ZAM8_ADICA|nr:hypothetical protein GOP47_0017495 [Adiantum capillus-veneris]